MDIHAYRPRSTKSVIERIVAWQMVCLLVTVALIWGREWASQLRDRSVPDSSAARQHTVVVLALGLAAVLPIYLYQRRYAHKLITICSYCRRVQVDEERDWTPIEVYFADKTHATYSHGVCPVCQERVMTAYRTSHGAENGADAALPTAAL